MEAKSIFGRRLKMARQKNKLSMENLANLTENAVSKQTISKYESGKAMAGSEILGKLASALNVTMDYFFRPFTFDMEEINISFRKKASVGAKEQSALKSKIQDKVERYLAIEKILSIDSKPHAALPSSTINNESQMVTLAKATRKAWGLGVAPIENAKDVLIRNGIKVFEVSGPDGFDGVSGAANELTWIMVLNEGIKHVERKRLTEFHEYAHLVANDYFDESLTQKEKEGMCNLFASEMLLPSEILIKSFENKTKISFQELVSLQSVYGISIDAIIYSLRRSMLISDKRYRGYWMRKNMDHNLRANLERSRFVEKETDDLSDSTTFTSMVCSALAQELITPTRAAEFLDCKQEEVESLSIAF